MPRIVWFLLLVVLTGPAALARQDLPVLKATSPSVDVQDGDRLWKGTWQVDPAAALDVYHAGRSASLKKVTFISDVESLSFDVQPGRTYDFDVLLNGVACHTRISTLAQSGVRDAGLPPGEPVSIPIAIHHGKLHLEGAFNDSRTLDLILDTGADINVLYPSAAAKGAKVELDGTITNTGTGGTTLRRTGSDNRIRVAPLSWSHEPVMLVEKQVDRADGIISYKLFEDRVVEFDFDRMVMLVHDALPARAADFRRVAMPFAGSLTAVEAVLITDTNRVSGEFILDTAGNGALTINQSFATDHALRETMPRVGESSSRGVGSATVRSDIMLLPQLMLAGFPLPNVPVDVERPTSGGSSSSGGALCMDVLRRFNTMLDYPGNMAYFRPNAAFDAPFESRASIPSTLILGGAVAVAIVSVVGLVVYRAVRRRAA